MEEVRYMISDAANLLHMESHVLRYWEEELDLKIPRNEMGHRYYTKENLQQFEQIRSLKEQGYQLKAIKMLIHNQNPQIRKEERLNMQGDYREVREELPENHICIAADTADGQAVRADRTESHMMEHPVMHVSESQILEDTTPLEQFRNMMSQIVKDAIAENNQDLGREVGEQVGERVLKEMNYLMREQEEQEEERYRKLDEAIRSRQMNRKEKKQKEKLSRRKAKAEKAGKHRFRTKESTV